MSATLKAAVLSLLCLSVQAKTKSVYSFIEGKSNPDGLAHGVRGHACLKEFHARFHGSDELTFLKEVEAKHGEEVTDEHVAAALFMAFGEKGIDNLCAFNDRRREDAERRRLVEASVPLTEKTPERRTQARSCSEGADPGYPAGSKADPDGIYSKYVSERLEGLLPEGKGAESRTSPPKMITEGQVLLDDALEGEYTGILCGSYFSAFTALASIPDLVVFKQGPILDGINSLTCGTAESVAKNIQVNVRSLLGDGMKHDALINQAETSATFENTVLIAEEMCAMNSNVARMKTEVATIKEKLNA